jgi:hypothetical protein
LLEGRARTAEKAQSKAGKERDRFIRGEAWDDDREYFLSTQKKVVISQEEAVVKAIRENPGQPVVRIQPPRHENTGLSH